MYFSYFQLIRKMYMDYGHCSCSCLFLVVFSTFEILYWQRLREFYVLQRVLTIRVIFSFCISMTANMCVCVYATVHRGEVREWLGVKSLLSIGCQVCTDVFSLLNHMAAFPILVCTVGHAGHRLDPSVSSSLMLGFWHKPACQVHIILFPLEAELFYLYFQH